ncbi:hypothetical protein PG999_012211 [Apiospora kogelbergensis]|uniref:Uncharacterized protein n=1 Tax=Apiospora kogelbergensis TaxID=1337665 RepID=A0AAW0QGI3_9PEZI
MTLAFAAIGEKKLLCVPSVDATSTRCEWLQNTMVLEAKGLSDQGKDFYVSLDILNVARNTMGPADVAALDRHIGGPNRNDEGSTQLRTRHIQARYPLNIVRVMYHPDERRLGALIKHHTGLSIEVHSTGPERFYSPPDSG